MKKRWCDYHEIYEPINDFYPSPYYDGISMICKKAKEEKFRINIIKSKKKKLLYQRFNEF